jgi:glycerol-3-phosphate dehydrogenase
MWERGWRDRVWEELGQQWDVIVIGGGITGAGILREAARAGLRVLLVEASDFASGTSSRSGKMVHGGLRYLQNAQIKLTIESVSERERLQREGRGLVNPLGFLLANFTGDRPPAWVFGLGLIAYDVLALKWGHRRYSRASLTNLCPQLTGPALIGGYRYFDAVTDDARLVLRVLREAVRSGGVALNYARVERLLRDHTGRVCGVALREACSGRTAEIQARVVINATGAWADDVRAQLNTPARLRRLRGSHLVFPWRKFPLTRAVTFLHPRDWRPLYALPWEGVTVVGTTDVDHARPLATDLGISGSEVEYLMAAVTRTFPSLGLTEQDVQATFAGVRPVVNTGKADPSKESREFVLWDESGLLTVTGGKLTTFRLMAHNALRAVRRRLPNAPRFDARMRVLDEIPPDSSLDANLPPSQRLRLLGRYGADARELLVMVQPGELERVDESPTLWAELRWGARDEGVVHLDDLLQRRVRLGLVLPRGGLPYIERIRAIAQPELRWDDARWEQEVAAYARVWEMNYSLPK